MRGDKKIWGLTLVGLLALALIVLLTNQTAAARRPALAASGPFGTAQMGSAHFGLDWNVVGTGGGKIASAHFQIRSTLGQPTTGWIASSHFKNHAGYWQRFTYRIFLPLVLRNYS
ncbi:MAG: hypothetical protein K8R89_00190 [Anaerolineae bacterium]|nr:hypothetical protein [Anaerolineae bacterium]